MRRKRFNARVALLGAVLAAALGVGVASAHVSVTPARVPPNSSQTFTLRVPTEREAPTIRLRVEFPTELTVSRFQPKPGWTREIERDSANRIIAATWSGAKIAPGEFDDFVFIARTPAAPGKLLVKAYQSYEGGETVAWVNPEEPNPAPVIEVLADTAAAATPTAADRDDNEGVTVATEGGVAAPAGSDLALFMSLAAVAIAAVAAILAVVALSRRPSASAG